jgi:hypothetical protein
MRGGNGDPIVLLRQALKFLASAALMAVGWQSSAQGTLEGIAHHDTPFSLVIGQNGTFGWRFQTTNTITLTGLGCFDELFINVPAITWVQVGLWREDGRLLASNSITPVSPLANQSRYEAVTPVTLSPGVTYHLGAYSQVPDLPIGICSERPIGPVPASLYMGQGIQLAGKAEEPTGFAFPAQVPGSSTTAYIGPNFQYHGDVPEPSSEMLFLLGTMLVARMRFGLHPSLGGKNQSCRSTTMTKAR